jgi:hypothetical protein
MKSVIIAPAEARIDDQSAPWITAMTSTSGSQGTTP